MEEVDFSELLSKLRTVTTGREWSYIKPRLRNERSLRQRLDEVVAEAGDLLGSLVSQYRNFIDRVVTTRNSLAHEGRLGKAFTYEELFWAQKTLENLFRALLLRRLDFTDDQVTQCIVRTADWRWLSSSQNRLAHWREYHDDI